MSNLRDFTEARARFEQRRRDVFVGVVQKAHESIQVGSPITGSPGQPVDTGFLRNSWQAVFESDTEAVVGTNVEYAEPIEDGIGPHGELTLRSEVGGFHSVKITRAGMGRIIEHVTAEVERG